MIYIIIKELLILFYVAVAVGIVFPFVTDTSKKILPTSMMPIVQLMGILSVFLTLRFLITFTEEKLLNETTKLLERLNKNKKEDK